MPAISPRRRFVRIRAAHHTRECNRSACIGDNKHRWIERAFDPIKSGHAFFNAGARVQGFHFQPWFDWILGGFATDTWQKRVLSLAVVVVLVWGWLAADFRSSPANYPAPKAPET